MQRLAIIGGTGMTGQCVVDYAIKKGLQLNVMYRNENTVPESFKNNQIQLIKGNATNLEDVKKVLKDVQGVCVILGTRNNLEPTTDLSNGTKNVVEAMKSLGLRKMSIVMSSFLFWDDEKVPKQFGHINNEHKKMLEIMKSSGLDYVAILPPHIADEPSSEIQILHEASPGRVVSKLDLAKFIVDCLEQSEHIGKICGIAKKPQ